MLTVAAPPDLNGDQLTAELVDAGWPDARVALVGDLLEIHGADEVDRSAVEAVIGAHVPVPVVPEPTLAEQLAAHVALQAQQIADRDAVDDDLIEWLLTL